MLVLIQMSLEGFKNPVSSQTDKLMAATKVSDCLGIKHCKKAKKKELRIK